MVRLNENGINGELHVYDSCDDFVDAGIYDSSGFYSTVYIRSIYGDDEVDADVARCVFVVCDAHLPKAFIMLCVCLAVCVRLSYDAVLMVNQQRHGFLLWIEGTHSANSASCSLTERIALR